MKQLQTLIILFCIAFTTVAWAAPDIVDLELEIDLKDGSEYDLEYEVEKSGLEAKYKVPGERTVYGQAALEKIQPFLNALSITPEVNKKTLKSDILSYLQIDPKTVSEFDLEITFANKEKLKIK